MTIHYGAVVVASVLQFIVGAIWYMPLFGKLWGKIHGFETQTPETQEKMKKGMMPLLAVQFVVTVVTTFVFALLLGGFPADWNIYGLAFFFWLGFVVPTQVSAVIFGGIQPQWIVPKIAVMAGGSLICLEVAAAVLHLM